MDVQAFVVKRRQLQDRLEQEREDITHALSTARPKPSLPGLIAPMVRGMIIKAADQAPSGLLKGIMTAAGGWAMSKLVPRRFLPFRERGIIPQLLKFL